MTEVISALAGVVVGVFAETIAYHFRRKTDRFVEKDDDLIATLEHLQSSYIYGDPRESSKISANAKRQLVRVLRMRSARWQRFENNSLLDEFNAISRYNAPKILDTANWGKEAVWVSDDIQTGKHRAELVQAFIVKIERLNPHI